MASSAERQIVQAAEKGQYSFIMFYRAKDKAADAMASSVARNLSRYPERGTATYVSIADPAQKGLVAKYGVARAPMPLTVALAPNGAITAMFPSELADDKFASAFVTPAEADALLALQQKKLVFIAISTSPNEGTPAAVADFRKDPHFRDRMQLVALNPQDAEEQEFLADLQVTNDNPASAAMIVLAPPGVMIGRFPLTASKDEIAAKIAAADKCCDDENCKHRARK
ncbi:MAG: hypothetical protein KF708_02110 [Pirellulales bacterium]|nr:hypothetical protein [Pirellulales bacterium]